MNNRRSPNPWHPSYPDVWKVLKLRDTDSYNMIQCRIEEISAELSNTPDSEERTNKTQALSKILEVMKTPMGRSFFRNSRDFEDSASGLTEKWDLFYEYLIATRNAKIQVNTINTQFKENNKLKRENEMLKRHLPPNSADFCKSLTEENTELNNEVRTLRKKLYEMKNDCERNHMRTQCTDHMETESLSSSPYENIGDTWKTAKEGMLSLVKEREEQVQHFGEKINDKDRELEHLKNQNMELKCKLDRYESNMNAEKTGTSTKKLKKTSKTNKVKRNSGGKEEKSTNKKKWFTCKRPDCRRVFSRKDSLDRHVRTKHEKHKPFKCEVCLHPFAQRSDLKCHMKAMHPDRPELLQKLETEASRKKTLSCDICLTTFSCKKSLVSHQRKFHSNVNENSKV